MPVYGHSLIKKILAYEPVMSATFAAGLLGCIANALRIWGVYDLTVEQQEAILNFGPYVVVLLGFIVRQEVTPTAKLP